MADPGEMTMDVLPEEGGFARLLLQLREEHEREVAGLRKTIEDLLRRDVKPIEDLFGEAKRGTLLHTAQPKSQPRGDIFVATLRENTDSDVGYLYDEDAVREKEDQAEHLTLHKFGADVIDVDAFANTNVNRSKPGSILDGEMDVHKNTNGTGSKPGSILTGEIGMLEDSNGIGMSDRARSMPNSIVADGEEEENHDHARSSTAALVEATEHKKGNKVKKLSDQIRKKKTHRQRLWIVFDAAIATCIMANMIFIFLRLEYLGYQTGVRLGIQEPGKWPELDGFFDAMQVVFGAIFVLELLIRIVRDKRKFFYSAEGWDKFNILDVAIVVVTMFDLMIITPFLSNGGESRSDLTIIRVVRFAKLLRAIQVVRTVEMFSKLRVLFSTVAASFYALFWSMVLLFISMIMGAFVLTQLVSPYLEDPRNLDEDLVKWMYKHYGTAGRSLWTMFEVTFSGGWPAYARRLVEEVSAIFAWIFAIYVACVVFAMTRIITALFLKDTLAAAASDAEMVIHEKTREKKAYAAKLLSVFHAADTSGDGKITLDEFENFLNNTEVKMYLGTLELDTYETRNLFHMLDDGDGVVTAEEFVRGAMRLKGNARSQDVVHIMHDFHLLNNKVTYMSLRLQEMHELLKQ